MFPRVGGFAGAPVRGAMGLYSGLNTQDGVEYTAEGGGECAYLCEDDLFKVSCHHGEGVGDVYLGVWGGICDGFMGERDHPGW